MPDFLTDRQIAALLAERKPLPADWKKRLVLKPKRGHTESELEVKGAGASEFRLLQRRSNLNPLDFSAILAYRFPDTNQILSLRRYNGRSHEHRNRLENERFYDFHIHTATERYQRTGHDKDAFAQVTNPCSDLEEATRCLLADCNFEIPEDPQGELF